MTPPDDKSPPGPSPDPAPIVGIGASAGGLAALETLFEQLPADTGACFVVVQHLSPDHDTHMPELLGRRTEMSTQTVTDDSEVLSNTVYVLPPKKHVVLKADRLCLVDRNDDADISLPVDRFFDSLSKTSRRTAGVVLSGTGKDGSGGIVKLNDAGGLVLAQDEDSAQFDGMPLNAMKTGAVHLVGTVPELAEALTLYLAGESVDRVVSTARPFLDRSDVEPIYQLLESHTGIDFTNYKDGTFSRRLARRLLLSNTSSLAEYLPLLDSDPAELNRLTDDLLIGVTRFFRDPDGFQRLRSRAVRPLVRNKGAGSELRIWVAGCATGQEAYSVAMIVADECQRVSKDLDIRIFATDVHPDAIRFAQKAEYPSDARNEIPDELAREYTSNSGEGFEIVPKIREMVVFARHDLLQDAPFTGMDLITCRNTLIYLLEEAQSKVLLTFGHSLKSRGILWLGPSETTGPASEQFAALDKHWRIFQKEREARLPLDLKFRARQQHSARLSISPKSTRTPSAALVFSYDKIMELYAPPGVLIDSDQQLLQTFGKTDRFIRPPVGRLSGTLDDVLVESLRTPVAVVLQRIRMGNRRVESEKAVVEGETIGVEANVFDHSGIGQTHYLLTFVPQSSVSTAQDPDHSSSFRAGRESESSQPAASNERPAAGQESYDHGLHQERVRMLELELEFTRENLQATIEELETTNEELQSSNEELTSSNEELQSTNEELHSVNEELHSTNAESERRVNLLSERTADLHNVLSVSDVGIVLLDDHLVIRQMTSAAKKLLAVDDDDPEGRPLQRVVRRFGLSELATQSLDTAESIETELIDGDNQPVLIRCQPYDKRAGVVVTLTDLSGVRETASELRKLSAIVSDSADSIIACDLNGRVTSWNAAATKAFGRKVESASKVSLEEALPAKLASTALRLIEEIRHDEDPTSRTEEIVIDEDDRVLQIRATPIFSDGQPHSVALTIYDVTQLRSAEQELRLRTRAIDAASNGIIIVDAKRDDLPIVYSNSGFEAITGFSADDIRGRNCRFLQGPGTARADLDTIRRAVAEKKLCRVTLLNYRRNGQPFYNDLIITPVHDDSGDVTHFVGVQHDVTDTVEVTQALKRSEAEYRGTFENAAVGIAHVGLDGSWLRVNQKLCDIVGYEKSELLKKTFQDITHKDDLHKDLDQFVPLMRGTIDGYAMEKRYIHHDGHVIWINLTTSLRRNLDGESECCISIIEDITARKRAEEALGATQTVISQVIENIEDVFLQVNSEGLIVVANPAARKFASDGGELVGKPFGDLFTENTRFHLGALLSRVSETHVQQSTEYFSPAHARWYDVRVVPLSNGNAVYMADVTARKETELQLEKARLAAEEASLAKSQFLANMSHEIRSPMSAVLGFSELALRDARDNKPVDQSYLETVLRNGRFLLKIINDILDLSKVEAGKLQLRKTKFKVVPMLAELLELMRHRSISLDVPLSVEFASPIPERMSSDRSRVEQILVNLIGNAIKFSPRGDVRLVVRTTEGVTGSVVFEVIDTGIGISEDKLSKLFESFSQVHDPSQLSGVEGTGLGLSISKRLANLLGGEITVESVEGEGSTFTLTLPVGKVSDNRLVDVSSDDLVVAASDTGKLAEIQAKLLVADDSDDVRFITQTMLTRAGAEVITVEDGAAAVEAVQREAETDRPFDCVLMDMQMPIMDGRAATQQLRELGFTLPIIALTAGAMSNEVEAAMNAGCTQFASKPVDIPDLLRRVAKLTHSRESE